MMGVVYIIREICHNFNGTPAIFFFSYLLYVRLQDISVYYSHIIPFFECVFKNRNECVVNLNRRYFSRGFRQILGP